MHLINTWLKMEVFERGACIRGNNNMHWKENRQIGLLIITMVYIIAGTAAVIVYRQLPELNLVGRIFWADITATLIVYLSGVVLNNATVYDAYWSVAPMVIVNGLVISLNLSGAAIWLLLFAVNFWGIRLTVNWVNTFVDLRHQDWRYDMLRNSFPKTYPLVSLGGIHLFPTLVVFFALVPAIRYIEQPALNSLTLTALMVCITATVLQFVADLQMQRFRSIRKSSREIMNQGLWKYARHPNYFGEILFWWGMYLFLLSARPELWTLCAGALLNTGMFLFISIPMAEKRLSRRKPGYAAYKAKTRLFLPLKK